MMPGHDFMVSPFSIYSLLSTLLEGATLSSDTFNEIRNVLELPQNLRNLGDLYRQVLGKLL